MTRCIRHYVSSLRYPAVHRTLCACKGHGFRYHILQIGR
jgi:hypothetical protein